MRESFRMHWPLHYVDLVDGATKEKALTSASPQGTLSLVDFHPKGLVTEVDFGENSYRSLLSYLLTPKRHKGGHAFVGAGHPV